MDNKALKRFGQNFLIDKNIINKIIESSNINKDTNVIEIGPGTGSLTKELVRCAKKVIAIEIDKKLCAQLKSTITNKNFNLICEDYLDIDLANLIKKEFNDEEVSIISNLPYYISSKIIFKNIENNKVKNQTLMVQKEYGQRIFAKPSTKDYGRLSVSVNALNQTEKLFLVKPNSFSPRPNVDSLVIRLRRKDNDLIANNEYKLFQEFIKMAFANKRKTIFNNLKLIREIDLKSTLESEEINTTSRPEDITLEQYIKLFHKAKRFLL